MPEPNQYPGAAGARANSVLSDDGRDAFAVFRHDLRAPLAVISGHAQMLRREARRLPGLAEGERDRLRHRAEAIEAAVRTMTEVVDGIGPEPGDTPARRRPGEVERPH